MAVYLIQRRITEYRRKVFETISNQIPDLVILTESEPGPNFECNWVLVRRRRKYGVSFLSLPDFGKKDVIISGLELANFSIWKLLLFRSKRFVLWGHGFGRSRYSFLTRWLRVAAARVAKVSIFYTEGARASFSRYVPADRLFVATNTISLPSYEPNPIEDRNAFLFFGDLRDEKGVHQLIDAFCALARAGNSKIQLLIVGDGPSKLELLDQAKRSGHAERIQFYPRTETPEDLKTFLDRAIATVSPLHVGLSVVQSFWAGVPVITQRNQRHAPEFEYCIAGENSLIYEGGALELADAMLWMLNDANRHGLSVGATQFYREHLSQEKMVSGFEGAVNCVRRDD